MKPAESEARERLLDAAERLFTEKGYASVTLRDIAEAVGIKHTSLYYHVPGGKESLFIEVTERMALRHEQGIAQAIEAAPGDWEAQLRLIAYWLLDQPPVDLVRMSLSDMLEINPDEAARLGALIFRVFTEPFRTILAAPQQEGVLTDYDPGLFGMIYLAAVQSTHAMPEEFKPMRRQVADQMLHLLLNGLQAREKSSA